MNLAFYRIIWLLRKMVANNIEKLIFLGEGEYGGKFLPGDLNMTESGVCISAGAGEDISFECELARLYNYSIVITDPTPRAITHYKNLCEMTEKGKKMSIDNSEEMFYEVTKETLGRIVYCEYGLSDESKKKRFYYPENPEWVSCSEFTRKEGDYFIADCLSYLDFLQRCHINPKDVKILKMDIEGSEYEVIKNIIDNNILPDILIFEVYKLPGKSLYFLISLLRNLKKAGMKLVFIKDYDFLYIKNQ